MNEILYPHSSARPGSLRLRLAALGLGGCLALGGLAGVLGLQTLGVVSDDVRVTVELTTVGDSLGINSDVKFNGLRVGRVIEVRTGVAAGRAETEWDGPSAVVLVDPEHAELIPGGVRARVLPGTLFGNDYVDLTPSATASSSRLEDGAVVAADTSEKTLRLMDTFAATQRLLAAIDPAQWDVALSQIAGSLDGRGQSLADAFVDANDLLTRWEQLHPVVRRDLALLARNSDLLAEVEPRLVNALRESRPLARTLIDEQEGTEALLAGTSALLDGEDGATAFLRSNGQDIAYLLNATAANLEVFARRHPSFALLLRRVPRLLANGAAAVRNGRVQMEGVLGLQGFDPYDATDCPSYRGLYGRCRGAE